MSSAVPALLSQIDVVNTFKSGTSFQGAGALRRQSSTTSQTQDVTNVSSPSHVSLSNALSSPTSTTAATAPPTTGRESELCQSASLFSLLQRCHPVTDDKLFSKTIYRASLSVCRLASLKVCLSRSLLFSYSLFCLLAVHTGFQNSPCYLLPCFGVLSSHWSMCVCFLRVLGLQD